MKERGLGDLRITFLVQVFILTFYVTFSCLCFSYKELHLTGVGGN